MIDVSELVHDPDFCQNFTVYRQTGAFGAGGFIVGTETEISFEGVITVASEKDLQQVPEGDRVEGAMMFYTTEQIFITYADDSGNSGTSDQILWNGNRYKVVRVWPYGDYGYWKSYGYRMIGE